MAADEEGTLATLEAHGNATDPIVRNHGGRIVERTGDGLLIEFPSTVEAVQAGVEAQRLMAEHNAALPQDRPWGTGGPVRATRRGRSGPLPPVATLAARRVGRPMAPMPDAPPCGDRGIVADTVSSNETD